MNRNIFKNTFSKRRKKNNTLQKWANNPQYKKEERWKRKKKSLKAMEGKIDINRTG